MSTGAICVCCKTNPATADCLAGPKCANCKDVAYRQPRNPNQSPSKCSMHPESDVKGTVIAIPLDGTNTPLLSIGNALFAFTVAETYVVIAGKRTLKNGKEVRVKSIMLPWEELAADRPRVVTTPLEEENARLKARIAELEDDAEQAGYEARNQDALDDLAREDG